MAKKQTYDQVIDSAIACLADLGIEQTTFQAIANHAGISQPLVVYHLKNRKNIFYVVINHLMDYALERTLETLSGDGTAAEQLRDYLAVSLHIFRSRPEFAKIYMAFYYLSSIDPVYQELNDRIKSEAVDRVGEILERGARRSEFSVKETWATAKVIHVSLTGLLLNLAGEKSARNDRVLLETLQREVAALTRKPATSSRKAPAAARRRAE